MRVSKILIFIFLIAGFSYLIPGEVKAQPGTENGGNFGFGIMVGEPTGVSIKSWNSRFSAFDVGAAWSLSDNQALHLHADFLMHSWFSENDDRLAFYYGIGGRVIFADDPNLGVRIPLGLNYVFKTFPFDLFVEAVPILDFTPDTKLAGNGAVGIRYYF